MLRQSIQWHAEDNVVISVSCERAQVHKKTLTGSKTDILHGACGMNENNDLISDHVPLPQMPPGPIAQVHRENWQRKTRTDNAEETRHSTQFAAPSKTRLANLTNFMIYTSHLTLLSSDIKEVTMRRTCSTNGAIQDML
jgi:hypothetical protein